METMKVSDLLEFTRKQCEERTGMYRQPIYVPVTMVVELDEQGRISRFSYPGIEGILGNRLIDDTNWSFAKDSWVFHKTLKQVGRFVEVDQWDPSSATVEFTEEDGYKEAKRISLSLLTSEIPKEYEIVYSSENGGDYTKKRILSEIGQWVERHDILAKVPPQEQPILHEIIYRTILPMLSWQAPSTILDELGVEDVIEILKMQEKAVLVAKWRYARLEFKNEDGTMNVEETAGYYLSEFGDNALQSFDDSMKRCHLDHASDKYLFWSRVRELIKTYKDVQ